jgi:hypothetical protein
MAFVYSYQIPVKTVSEANQRAHWSVKARRAKAQRAMALVQTLANVRARGSRYEIAMMRIGQKRLDDDNLAGALKAVQDGISQALGINDGSDAVKWTRRQFATGHRTTGAVDVTVIVY